MNKVVIIGNGFDLAHRLPTRYTDFMLWYLNKCLSNAEIRNRYNDKLIAFEFSKRFMSPHINSFQDFKELIRIEAIRVNYGHQFINSIINESLNRNWVDIESLYYQELVSLYRQTQANGRDLNRINSELKNLNECFDFLKSELIEYLKTIEIKGELRNDDIDLHIQSLFKRLNRDEKVIFLNFNYTNTNNIYLNTNRFSNYEVINIHGELLNENNPIIFGYGDELDSHYEKIEQLNSNEYLKNIKSFWYFKTYNYQSIFRLLGNSGYNIFIMGHSCGLSDRILLNNLFEPDRCEHIRIYYHQISNTENDYFEKTQEISRHFRPAYKEKMRLKVIDFTNCEPLVSIKS